MKGGKKLNFREIELLNYTELCGKILLTFLPVKNHLKISPKLCFWSLFIGKF